MADYGHQIMSTIVRIGGEFEISPDLLANEFEPPAQFETFRKNHLWLDTGRSAIYVALRNIISLGTTKTAWLPAFLCHSITEVFLALDFKVNFYPVRDDLSVDLSTVDLKKGDAFFFIHYFGTINNEAVNFSKKTKGIAWTIEDIVQSTFTENIGLTGDFVVTSLRKWLPQPDGALLATDHNLNDALSEELQKPDETYVTKKVLGKILRSESKNEDFYLNLFSEAESSLLSNCPRAPSKISKMLMERVDVPKLKKQRVENYRSLAKHLVDQPHLTMIYPEIKNGIVPLGCPVIIEGKDRDFLRKYLKSMGIFCPVHWELHSEITPSTESAHKLSKKILTFPIDQRYNIEHMGYIAEKIREGLNE